MRIEFPSPREVSWRDEAKPPSLNKIGRNDPCPCGSGRKHKQCCLRAALRDRRGQQLQLVTDRYGGDRERLREGPWRENGQLMAEVQWVENEAWLTCASLAAADRLRSHVEKLGLVHLERQLDAPQALPEAAPPLGMLSFKRMFFERWPDEPLEKLAGLTPRQAASGAQRPALLELVRSLEAREERLPPGERYDFQPLRRGLGL